MLEIGSKVRIKDNAYGGSRRPDAIRIHGKLGEVLYIHEDGETMKVKMDDGELEYLTVDEVEEIK